MHSTLTPLLSSNQLLWSFQSHDEQPRDFLKAEEMSLPSTNLLQADKDGCCGAVTGERWLGRVGAGTILHQQMCHWSTILVLGWACFQGSGLPTSYQAPKQPHLKELSPSASTYRAAFVQRYCREINTFKNISVCNSLTGTILIEDYLKETNICHHK